MNKQDLQNKKSILITGGAGFIGTHLVEKLLNKGYKVCILDRFIFGEEPISDFKKNKNFQIIKGPLEDSEKIRNALHGVYAVVHLAGLVGDPACEVDEKITLKMNVYSTRTIKDLSKAVGVNRFVFASSCSVYGASDKIMNESSKVNPVSLYAKTKVTSEMEILSDSSKDFHPVILRFGTVFGHSRRVRFDLVGNLFVAQAYINGLITVIGNRQWRSFVHVSDVAEAIVKSIEAPLGRVDRQIFNVGDDKQSITIGELAKLASEVVGKNKEGKNIQVIIKDDALDKKSYKVSCKKIRSILGFKAKTTIKSGLTEIYRNFLKGIYKKDFKDSIYSNVETTKMFLAGNK